MAVAVIPAALAGCDKVREWLGSEKGDNLALESEVPGAPWYDKVALKRRFGEPQEAPGKLGWIKKEFGVRYNNKWVYHYRKNKNSMELTTRALYFIDDEFQGAVIIDEDGSARREKLGSLQ